MITRTRLRCNEKDCPARESEEFHQPVCLGINVVESWAGSTGHSDEAQHQHVPKRSQGGKTVVAVLCSWCHDRIDNGPWGNSYVDGEYRIYDIRNNTLLRCYPLGASTAEGEAIVSEQQEQRQRGHASLSAADVSMSEAPSEGGGTRPRTPLSPNLADDAGRDSREFGPTLSPAAATSPSIAEQEDADDKDGKGVAVRAGNDMGRQRSRADGDDPIAPSIAESLKPNGLELPDEFTFSDWTELAGMVTGMNLNRQWWAGDLILAGERFGERATQHWNDLGYKYESLANCVRVCRRFPLPLRSGGISFAHHAVVYTLDEKALHYLRAAEVNDWTVKQLREAVHGVKPRTVRFTLDELRERAAGFTATEHRNHGPRFLAAYLDSLEAS